MDEPQSDAPLAQPRHDLRSITTVLRGPVQQRARRLDAHDGFTPEERDAAMTRLRWMDDSVNRLGRLADGLGGPGMG